MQLAPGDADLSRDLGAGLAELQRVDEALLSFQHALKLKPDHWDAAYRCGFLLRKMNRPEEALPYFDLVDRLNSNQHVVLEMRALVLHSLKPYEEALADKQGGLHKLNPGKADTSNNIGAALQFLRRDEEALPWFDRALALSSRATSSRSSTRPLRYSKCSGSTRPSRFNDHVRNIDPDNAEPEWNTSLIEMLDRRLRGRLGRS